MKSSLSITICAMSDGVIVPFLDRGVMSFATDHPDVAVREFRACHAVKKTAKRK